MAENENKARDLYNQKRKENINSDKSLKLQDEQVELLKELLEVRKRKQERNKEISILNDVKKEIIKVREESRTLKETVRDTLVGSITGLDKNISGFIRNQVMTGGADFRNRFSRTTVGSYFDKYDKKVDTLEKASSSVISKIIKGMVLGGAVTTIVTGIASSIAFKKFFSSMSEETKTTSRMFKSLIVPAVQNMKFMKDLRKQQSALGIFTSNIRKHGLLGGTIGGAMDFKRAQTDKIKNISKSIFGDTFNNLKSIGTKAQFGKDFMTGASGVLAQEGGEAALKDVGKISQGAGKLKGAFMAGMPGGIKGIYGSMIKEAGEISKLAKSFKFQETLQTLKKAGMIGLGKAAQGPMAQLVKGAFGAIGNAGKLVTKGLGKAALKRIPMIGGIFSIMSGIDRWGKGGTTDKIQALIDFGSGAANFIPGIGWPISLGLDMLNMGIDFARMDPGKGTAAIGAGAKVFKYTSMGLKVLKKIPGLGLIISTGLGMKKWNDGDKTGALLEFASGLASTIPGLGTIASIGIDLISTARDFKQFETGSMMDKGFTAVKKFSEDQMRNMPVIGTFIRLKEAMALWNSGDKAGAMKAGAVALSTMIPGVGIVYSLMDYFGGKKSEVESAGTAGKAAPKTATGASGKLTKSQMSGLAKGYKEKLSAAKAKGDKAGIAFWESKQDALTATAKAGGIPTDEAGSDNVKTTGNSIVLQDSGVNINGLNSEVKSNLMSMSKEYFEQTGNPLQINSAYRNVFKQNELYNSMAPGKAAQPGRSMHNWGVAFDIQSEQGNALSQMGLLDKYGFHRPIGAEPWHIEAANIDRGSLKQKGESVAAMFRSGKKPTNEELKATGLPMAALGAISNTPTIAGEAGPEAIIPLNDRGINILAEAINRAVAVNSARSSTNRSGEDFKNFLVDTFAKALANEIGKVNKVKNQTQSNAPTVSVL